MKKGNTGEVSDSEDDLLLSYLITTTRNEANQNDIYRSEHYNLLIDLLSANGYMLVKVP